MKALTTQEKARAYDEAYKVAESIHRFSSNPAEIKRMEEIFPELKESEDERIRKEILEYFQQFENEELRGVNISDWIDWLEKQGEQNISDMIEPRFKVSDYIINTITKEVEQVIELTDCEYICSGHLIVSFNNQHLLKKWTIQDAKDGDVLVNGSNIFIFHFINDTRLMGYCHVNTDDGRFYDDIGRNECFCLIDAVVNPATKEQRDLLFKAMEDAGYEWDIDKKELKKIERNIVWSEEDETVLDNLIYALANDRIGNDRDEYVDWLKSLRPQNTWKPSEEQIKACKEVYADILSTKGFDLGTVNGELNRLEDHLKNLKG